MILIAMESSKARLETDELDLLLLEALVRHPGTNYKQMAELLHIDQRTVAKRIKNLTDEGVLKPIIEIDWSKLGLNALAYIGSSTARGVDYVQKLNELIRTDPRIVKGYETLGAYQYLVKVIDTDTFAMRDQVVRDLDPLAAELTTSLVTKKIKEDYGALLRYLRETRFPRSRSDSDRIP